MFVDLVVVDGQIVNLDPVVAVGYDFEITAGGGNFASMSLPIVGLDTEFELSFLDHLNVLQTVTLNSGDVFDFLALTGGLGVNAFSVRDIDPGEGLDPANPLAFVTALSFIGTDVNDPITVSQDPFTIDTDANNVPVPGALALLGAGLFCGCCLRVRLSGYWLPVVFSRIV